MAAIIDTDNFVGVINIDTSKNTTVDELEAFALIYEPLYLNALMGTQMYFDFMANLTDTKYTNLINGTSEVFQWEGRYLKLNGLKVMLSYFIYFHYLQTQKNFNSIRGQVEANIETATKVNPSNELIRAYNFGVQFFNECVDYIQYKSADYPLQAVFKMHPLPAL
jgi:hypothetical protein